MSDRTHQREQVLKPAIFGKHCLLERVSVGGMAEVYRAKPFNAPNFRRFLAVKRILPNLAEDDEFIGMFIDEAKIAVQLNHKNICQIYELGKLNSSYYIVMEFIAGKDLLGMQNFFRRNRRIMSVSQAAYIVANMCDGLDYSHRKVDDRGRKMSIVHRDISPQNCLVAYDGDVKVIDFGIARAATKSQQTQVGVLKGKFGYMSPEQVTGRPLDQRSDVFALGALFWELLTARRLFHAETDFATLEKVRNADVAPPSTKNPKVPPEIDRIVMKALTRDREERYQWCSEMGRDLRNFLRTVKPAYTQKTLSSWMVTAFADDLRKERNKVRDFQQFVSAEDVRKYNDVRIDGVEELEELDLDEFDDATQVFDSTGLEFEGEKSLIFAANELEPLPTVVMSTDTDYGLPTDDVVSNTGRFMDTDQYLDSQISGKGQRRETLLIAVVGVLLAGVGVLAYFAFGSKAPQTGSLLVNVTPAEGVQLLIEGELQTGGMPLRIDEMEPGSYFVELRHDEFEPIVAEVTIAAGSTVDFTRELVPIASGEGTVTLQLGEHPSAQVFVDGQIIDGTGTERSFNVTAVEEHVLEVFDPGYFVEIYEFEVRTDSSFSRTVNFRPVLGTLSLNSTPAGTVFINDEEQGNTQTLLTIEELDPLQVYELEIRPRSRSYRAYEQTIVFDGSYNMRLAPRLRRVTEDAEETTTEYGYITAGDAERWFRIVVDGRDTGLVTPLSEDQRLPLTAGERTVTFARAGDERSVTIMVTDDETLHVEVPAAE